LENDNLPDGVARNILRVNRQHKSAVLEAAMFGPGIIRQSTRMIKPKIAVITSIQRVHLIRFGSMQKIINYKAEILDVLSEKSTLIVNGEDKNCAKLPFERYNGTLLRFGFSNAFDIWASDIRREGFRTYFTAHYKSTEMKCMINIIGRYNVGNALAAIMVGLKLGLTEEQIVKGLAAFRPIEGRLKLHKKHRVIILNDNFNANPDSTQQLLKELRSLSVSYPVVLVLGDIERPSNASAAYSRRVHFAIGKQLADINFKYVLAIGKWAREYVRGAVSSGMPKDKIEYFPTVQAARSRYRSLLAPGTVVVLKASVYTPVRNLIRN
jgi:UDP-N-acetylmuramoyl-tripeptide--D-alanyl-D-alanine ligase